MLDQQFCELVVRAAERAQLEVRLALIEPGRAKGTATQKRIPVAIGISLDRRSRLSLYCAIIQTSISPASVVRLTAALGRLDSADGPDGLEFRAWSPYRVEDLRASRRDAAVWIASVLIATSRALGFPVAAIASTQEFPRPEPTLLPAVGSAAAGVPVSDLGRPPEGPGAVQQQPEEPTGTSDHAEPDVLEAEGRPTSNTAVPPAGDPANLPEAPVVDDMAQTLHSPPAIVEPQPKLDVSRLAAEAAAAAAEAAIAETRDQFEGLIEENRRLADFIRGVADRSAAPASAPQVALIEMENLLRDARQREESAAVRVLTAEAEISALQRTLAASEASLVSAGEENRRMSEVVAQASSSAPAGLGIVELREQVLREHVGVDQVRAAVLAAVVKRDPSDVMAREALAGALLNLDEAPGAVAVLEPVVVALTPTGAARLVEAALRSRSVPPLETLSRCDWSAGQAAAEFQRTTLWMKPAELVAMAAALDDNWPPGTRAWLEAVSKSLRGAALEQLFDAWCEFDEKVAAAQLVDWVSDGKVSPAAETWAANGLELVAIESTDRKVALAAFRQLLDAGRRKRDWDAVDRLLSRARSRLTSKDWLQVGIEAVLADLQGVPARHAALPALVEELMGLGGAVHDRADQRELVAAGRELVRVLPSELTPSLRARLDSDVAKDAQPDAAASAVTSVYEALAYARDRFPGLVVLREAEDSARQRGSAGTRQALESLVALGEWAERFAGDAGQSTWESMRSLPGFREDISDTAKQQFRRHYDRRLEDGTTIQLGPHLEAGGNGGRIYFYVDVAERRVIVGHVGKHLPGRRDA